MKPTADHLCGAAVAGDRDGGYVGFCAAG